MRRLWLAVLCVSMGCASAQPKRVTVDPSVLPEADAKVLQGCYDCLLEAREAYQRAATGQARPLVIQRLFETELLVALRETEFALPSSGALDRARGLVTELPATLEGARYVELVDNIPAEHGSWTRSEVRAFRTARQEFGAATATTLTWLTDGALAAPVRQYIAMTLDCAYPRPRGPATAPLAITRLSENPPALVRYRYAACIGRNDTMFSGLRTEIPNFAEAAFFLGTTAVEAIPLGGPDPRPLIAEVSTRFPTALAVTYLSARFQQSVGRCDLAMTLYDRVIATRPEYEDAWLGRTMCLSDLRRSREAVDAATHMIDSKLDNLDDALYWRAWNYHSLTELPEARRDIDARRRMGLRQEVMTLAGIIEHDQNDLPPAERDLTLATRLSATDCTAHWFLGSVFVKQGNWPSAAVTFDAAHRCFDVEAGGLEAALAKVETNDKLDAEYKSAQSAKLKGRIAIDRAQQRGAALNAAKSYAAVGDLRTARSLLIDAAAEPSLKADVDELQAWLDKTSRGAAAP